MSKLEMFALKTIEDVMNLEEGTVKLTDHFRDDLGADSIDLMEIVGAMETEYGVEVDLDDLAAISTVEDAIKVLEKLI